MEYLHNYITEHQDKDGFYSFSRFYPEQLVAYQDNAMFRAMSKSTAGMYLGFYTTGSKISFTCRTESRLKVVMPIIKQVKMKVVTKTIKKMRLKDFYPKKQKRLIDGIDLIVDDTLMETVKAKKGQIQFLIENPEKQRKKIRIFFPVIESMSIKDLRIDGDVTAFEEKEHMLCLGDSITQGMIAGGPSLNYVALVADALGMDALNQGVGGYTFEVESLHGLEQLPKPSLVTVAYGTNDWTNKENLDQIRKDIKAYFARLYELYPDIPVFVLTPIWRADESEIVPSRISFDTMGRLLKEIIVSYPNMQLIDGMDLVDHDRLLYSDSNLHPNAIGFSQMAKKIAFQIKVHRLR